MARMKVAAGLLVWIWMEAGYAQALQWQDYFLLPSGSHFSYETHIKSLFRRHDGTITIRQSGTVRIGNGTIFLDTFLHFFCSKISFFYAARHLT